MPYFWPLHLILCPLMWPCSPIQSLLDSAFSEIKSLFSEVNVEEADFKYGIPLMLPELCAYMLSCFSHICSLPPHGL